MTRLALPEWRRRSDDVARVLRDIDAWAGSEAFDALAAASGASLADAGGRERIESLARVSVRWDARGGRERDLAEHVRMPPELVRSVSVWAGVLGLAGREVPSADRYDALLMTGGMVRAQIVKPRFVRELLDRGTRAAEVVFLGAFRRFSAEERALGSALGIAATDEVDAMIEGLALEFGPLGEPERVSAGGDGTRRWLDYSWRRKAMSFHVLAAPSSDPTRRANTADTFRFWATRRSASTERVLAVTTPIYVPYQATVAVDVLGQGADLEVETVGATATSLDLGGHSQPFLAQHHLQELRSAVMAMSALRATLAGHADRS